MNHQLPVSVVHGASHLPAVDVEAYNAELRDGGGFIGDRASNRAFRAILDDVRERLRIVGDDPLGDKQTDEISKKKLDKILAEGDIEAAGVVQGAIEGFATELATVTGRFLRLKGWRNVKRIVVGGGLRASRVGELAIGRAAVILKSNGHAIEFSAIRHDPDEAGLIGTIHLAPAWIFKGFDGILAVDIGGSNIRVGIVQIASKKGNDLAACKIARSSLWRHCDDEPTRDEAVAHLVKMLRQHIHQAEKDGVSLAPFIGIGCPGVIEADGSIEKGAQNLPGNWESTRFNLPAQISEHVPRIGSHDTHIVIHNDAVVQGLSQVPFMQDVDHWGVLTIGTGLGNASFFNHSRATTGSTAKAIHSEEAKSAK
jgi:predicted NBD/HSP70 family sugar kinase